ncbi:hypothetical protein [Roseomonas sp. BN140053]|uniref:hypothetical protein n=1 Tax=Roseomonas sp. BN140053 TaxID=3391898 RepID=UPI0039ECD10E
MKRATSGILARPLRLAAVLLLVGPLGACAAFQGEASADLAGIGGAAVADAVGAGAGVTTGIGFGVRAATRAGLQYAQRRVHGAAQNRIAAAAGDLPVGGIAPWNTDHAVPLEPEERGRVTVSRIISAGTLSCKEVVFSVEAEERGQPRQSFFTAILCRDGAEWRWASAEPATERWGNLQ